MITRIKIDNFKSLVDFELPDAEHELSSFTCFIGLNGSGKSTLLQAFDFIAHVASGEVREWLTSRDWQPGDLAWNLGPKKNSLINFSVRVRTNAGALVEWQARYNINQLKCTWELIETDGTPLLKLDNGWVAFARESTGTLGKAEKLQFDYQGSVVSRLLLGEAHPLIWQIKQELLGLRSLELLSPREMRRRAKQADDIGAGGEKLSAFLSGFDTAQKNALVEQLSRFYPSFQNFHVNTLRYGWKNLRVWERYQGHSGVDATHLNDGLLRVIAILAQAQTRHGIVLFDEIENGINPALVEKLMDFLVGLGAQGKQVIVTTHSPVILNFLEDKVARDGVLLLYKTTDGRTRACRYFDQPETGYKLKALGPGEVFVDTDLTKLVERLAENTPAVPQGAEGKK